MVKFVVCVCVCQFNFLIELMMICYLSVRQLLQALPSRPLSNGYVQQKRLLSSPSSPKKEVLQSIKRYTKHTQRRNTDTNLTLTEVSLFVCFFMHLHLFSEGGCKGSSKTLRQLSSSFVSSPFLQEEYVHRASHPGEERDGSRESESDHLLQQLLWWQKVTSSTWCE